MLLHSRDINAITCNCVITSNYTVNHYNSILLGYHIISREWKMNKCLF